MPPTLPGAVLSPRRRQGRAGWLEVLTTRLIEAAGCARLLVKRFVALALGEHDVVIRARRMRGPQAWIVGNGDLP